MNGVCGRNDALIIAEHLPSKTPGFAFTSLTRRAARTCRTAILVLAIARSATEIRVRTRHNALIVAKHLTGKASRLAFATLTRCAARTCLAAVLVLTVARRTAINRIRPRNDALIIAEHLTSQTASLAHTALT